MARARRRTRPEPSNFPFLSILACVMGTLALLITSMAIGMVAEETVDVDRYEALQARIDRDRLALASLETLAGEVETLLAELSAARAEAEALQAQLGSDPETTAPLRERLDLLAQRRSALERELALLARGARERSSELDARRESQSAPFKVRPSGSGKGLVPYFVESRPTGLVLHTARGLVEVPAHRIATSANFRNFVRGVAQLPNAEILFLIRPGGVAPHEIALKSIRERRLRTAEIPIPGDAPLDLSAFDLSRSETP